MPSPHWKQYVDKEFLDAHGKTLDDNRGFNKQNVCKYAEYYFNSLLDPSTANYRNGVLLTKENQLVGIMKFFGNKAMLSTAQTPQQQKHGFYLLTRETYQDAFYAIRNQERSGWAHIDLRHDLFPIRKLDPANPAAPQLLTNLRNEYARIQEETPYTTP